MSKNPNARPQGQVRHSQVVTTFGPGALLDLPNHSVIVGGLDHWFGVGEEVHEPRLVEKLKHSWRRPTCACTALPPTAKLPRGQGPASPPGNSLNGSSPRMSSAATAPRGRVC